MSFETYSYRHGEIVLNSNYKLRKEIEDTLRSLSIEHGEKNKRSESSPYPHKAIVDTFKEKDWKEYPVSSALEREKIDLFDRQDIRTLLDKMEEITAT